MTERTSKLLAIPSITRVAGARLALVALLAGSAGRVDPLVLRAAPQDNEQGREAAMKDFLSRVDQYMALRKTLQPDLPAAKPGDRGTGRVEARQDTLAARIQAARTEAKRGDIFGEAAPYLTRTIARDTRTRGLRDAYAAMEEVPGLSPPAVNALYPEKAALATVPPLILVNLPRLPEGVEYRFMGHALILRDRDANLVLDFIPGAVPVLKP